MANVKISNLPTASTPLTGAELVPVVQSGVTSQTTVGGLLGGPNGSNLAGFLQSGTGAVATTVQTKLRETVSVKDFGADPTGATSSVAAFNTALLQGGTVHVPSGTYKLDGKVSFIVNNTTLVLAANVTLMLSGVPAVQSPFGNQIHVIADNCSIIGSGPSSLLQITNGSQANAIGLWCHSGLTVKDIAIDGAKSTGSAIVDDTFMSGISIVVYAPTTTGYANATIDNVQIRNFLQYGINIYGDYAHHVKVTNCTIYNNGKTGDALSVGAGIVTTKNVYAQIYSNNVIYGNKSNGIVCSSAGQTGGDYIISNNEIYYNGNSGILMYEDTSYGSVVGQGLRNITITGNICTVNTRSGIEIIASVGFVRDVTITGNVCNSNTLYGIYLAGQVTPIVVQNILLSNNDIKYNGTNLVVTNTSGVEGAKVSFTPVIQGTTTAGTGTYSSQNGSYVKNGNIVTFEFEITWTAHTGTGNIIVAGLPYAASTGEPQSVGWCNSNNLTITGQSSLIILANQTNSYLYSVNNGTSSPVAMDTAASLRCTGSYFTNQ